MACARIGQNRQRLEHYWNHLEESRIKAKEWYQIQKDKGQTQWDRMKNVPEFKDKQVGYRKTYYSLHKEDIKARNREWSRRNPKRERLLRKIDEYIESLQEEEL